ncbi:hypothetical protein [Glycomyces tritici]|uniref:BZIP domain-containing protein n=1 Tax=Glycomyces tritici TaxID=2665176 RepID=A0ABT7YQT1_9ACTN|nr:hypothetical protein [Glycomyces tritici]MDN3240986.1 hypothetical protein [Glycomyces tritici]
MGFFKAIEPPRDNSDREWKRYASDRKEANKAATREIERQRLERARNCQFGED